MPSKNSYKIGEHITAKTTNSDGDTIFVSGNIMSITESRIFITKKFPKTEHYSVKFEDVVMSNRNKQGVTDVQTE